MTPIGGRGALAQTFADVGRGLRKPPKTSVGVQAVYVRCLLIDERWSTIPDWPKGHRRRVRHLWLMWHEPFRVGMFRENAFPRWWRLTVWFIWRGKYAARWCWDGDE